MEAEELLHDLVNNDETGHPALRLAALRTDLEVLVYAFVNVGLVRLEIIGQLAQQPLLDQPALDELVGVLLSAWRKEYVGRLICSTSL